MAERYYSNTVLVEGWDDGYVLRELLQTHGIQCGIVSRGRVEAGGIAIHCMEGITNLLESLPIFLNRAEVNRLGIVVDADVNLHARWQAVRDRLNSSSSEHVLQHPEPNGTILNVEQTGKSLTVGIWLMPDNNVPGILEDFVSFLVPAEDLLWVRAISCVAEIPDSERPFATAHQRKAEIHTWLAWQREPGTPLGQAVTAHYLDPHAPHAQQFVNWVQRLFELS